MENQRINILTPLQKEVLQCFFSVPELKKQFYLTGGTALSAFYLGHRLSDDLDLFAHTIELHEVERLVEDTITQAGLKIVKERGSATFRRYKINGMLQVDLVKDVEFRLGIPELHENFMVDNIKNIAVNKVCAIYGRLDPKDYVDLFFLNPYMRYDILELLELAKQKDTGIDHFQWAKVIADVDTLTQLPKMLKPINPKDLKSFFHKLRETIVDSLKPRS